MDILITVIITIIIVTILMLGLFFVASWRVTEVSCVWCVACHDFWERSNLVDFCLDVDQV